MLKHCWSRRQALLPAAPAAKPPSHQRRRTVHPAAAPQHRRSLAMAASASEQQRLNDLVQDAIVWASQHGLVVGLGGSAPEVAIVHAPLSLLPVAFPKERFEQAKAAMPLFNRLVDAVAADEAYLSATLARAAEHDDFTAQLLTLMTDTATVRRRWREAGREVVLGVHRSDYMLDAPSTRFLQVELNTIASSFGCLSTLTSAMHRYLLDRLTNQHSMQPPASAAGAAATAAAAAAVPALDPANLPSNSAMQGIADGMAAAVAAYLAARPSSSSSSSSGSSGKGSSSDRASATASSSNSSSSSSSSSSMREVVALMVVQPGERNAYDQQWLATALWDRHRLRVRRASLADIAARGRIEQSSGALLYGAPKAAGVGPGSAGSTPQQQQQQQPQQQEQQEEEVGLVYFRAGYTPNDYTGQEQWDVRRLIEESAAAKCPSVCYQLAGAKKVQQDLAGSGALERFVSVAEAEQLRGLFAGLWSLDDATSPETADIIASAIQNPERYVLKPQREGGGNNLYGPELAARLQEGGPGLSAYILMQRILPPPQRSVLMRQGQWSEEESVSELGIYGTFVRRGQEVLLNAEVGHLVRTKTSSSNEGGVAAGFAVLDSPYLIHAQDQQPGSLAWDVLDAVRHRA